MKHGAWETAERPVSRLFSLVRYVDPARAGEGTSFKTSECLFAAVGYAGTVPDGQRTAHPLAHAEHCSHLTLSSKPQRLSPCLYGTSISMLGPFPDEQSGDLIPGAPFEWQKDLVQDRV